MISWLQARKVDRRVKACQGLIAKATVDKPVKQQQTQACPTLIPLFKPVVCLVLH